MNALIGQPSHSPNTPLADPTMMGTWRPKRFAARAHRPLFAVVVAAIVVAVFPFPVVQIGEVHARLRNGNRARIGEDRLQMGHAQQEDDRIEADHVDGTPDASK